MQKSSFNFQLEVKDTTFREGTGISNLDGRLWDEVGVDTARFFGDEALVRARVAIEARYLIALSETKVIRKMTKREKAALLSLPQKITPKVYKSLRKIEAEVRHDVITMTQIMQLLLSKTKSLSDIIRAGWIHWGLSSEDIDNLARSVLIKDYIREVFLPQAVKTIDEIVSLSIKTKNTVIPGKTHLQNAVPTILGKEIAIFGIRLAEIINKIKLLKLRGKLTGAVGNLSAHKSAYPKINWLKFSFNFVSSLGLEPNLFTTQIEPKIKLIELFQLMQNVNLILIDLSQDMRIYTGFDWLTQEVRNKESGSSAMPQKVNPIDFENAHGNALLSNWILEGLIRTLPVSWLQRDLVDKTILRNLGLPFGYSLIALISASKGLSRVVPNESVINADLESDWSILSEAFQVNLRAFGIPEGYDELKKLARGKKLTKEDIGLWIDGLKVKPEIKKSLRKIDFSGYTGYARKNLQLMLKEIAKTLLQISQ